MKLSSIQKVLDGNVRNFSPTKISSFTVLILTLCTTMYFEHALLRGRFPRSKFSCSGHFVAGLTNWTNEHSSSVDLPDGHVEQYYSCCDLSKCCKSIHFVRSGSPFSSRLDPPPPLPHPTLNRKREKSRWKYFCLHEKIVRKQKLKQFQKDVMINVSLPIYPSHQLEPHTIHYLSIPLTNSSHTQFTTYLSSHQLKPHTIHYLSIPLTNSSHTQYTKRKSGWYNEFERAKTTEEITAKQSQQLFRFTSKHSPWLEVVNSCRSTQIDSRKKRKDIACPHFN